MTRLFVPDIGGNIGGELIVEYDYDTEELRVLLRVSRTGDALQISGACRPPVMGSFAAALVADAGYMVWVRGLPRPWGDDAG